MTPHETPRPDPYDAGIRAIYRQIYASVGNREEAERLTTQVVLGAARRPDLTHREPEGVPWLTPAAWQAMEDRWQGMVSAPSGAPEDIAEERESAQPGEPAALRVGRILADLPACDREFLTARFLEGRTLEETAARMRLTLPEALALQHRALRRAAAANALAESSLPDVSEMVAAPDEAEAHRTHAAEEAQPCCCGG